MLAAEWRWQGCVKFIPISCVGPKHATKDTFDFSTSLYAVEHLHVVQIWIMHLKCLQNQVNVWKCPNEPRKIPKINTTLRLFYVDTRKKFKIKKRQRYRFVQKGETFLTKTIRLVVRSSGCEKLIPKPAPNGKNYHSMSMPLHASTSSFMDFRRVLDLLEFKNHVSQCLRPSDGGRVFEIHSHFLLGT